jgi:ribosomal protein L28
MSCAVRARRAKHLQDAFGLTPRQYTAMLKRQGGKCAICGRKPKPGQRRLAVDHAHDATKRVRCLACHACNRFRIGLNTPATAIKVFQILDSEFDGRLL